MKKHFKLVFLSSLYSNKIGLSLRNTLAFFREIGRISVRPQIWHHLASDVLKKINRPILLAVFLLILLALTIINPGGIFAQAATRPDKGTQGDTGSIQIVKDAVPPEGTDFVFTQNANPTFTFLRMWGWGVNSGAFQFEICAFANLPCQQGTQGSGSGQFDNPYGLAVDSSGNVYVAELFDDHIKKFDSDGNFLLEWDACCGPFAVGIDQSDNVYVTFQSQVKKFDSNGTFLLQWGSSGDGNGEFDYARGVAFDASGNVYIADGNDRIQKFDNSGAFIMKWGSSGSGAGQFGVPLGMGVDTSGNVYVVDGGGNERIQKFDSNGVFLRMWGWGVDTGAAQYEICTSASLPCQAGILGNGDGQFHNPWAVALDAVGNVYMTDQYNHRIQKFDASGNFLLKLGSEGGDDGEFEFPTGIGIDVTDNIYIAETGNHRVQKFGYDFFFRLDDAVPDDGDEFADYLTFENLDPGSYTFTETLPVNWILSDILCTGGSSVTTDQPNQKVTVNLAADEDVVCTFQNETPSITIIKDANPSDGTNFAFTTNALNDGDFLRTWGRGVDTNLLQTEICTVDSLPCYDGEAGSGDGQFDIPHNVAVDSMGYVYVSDVGNHRIQKFDSSGNFIAKWGSEGSGAGQFDSPYGLAVDLLGNVYVVDGSVNGQHRIQKFDTNGNFLRMWGWGVDTGTAQFEICTSASLPCQAGILGSGNGQFNAPSDIAVDVSGNVFVADNYNERIQKFDSSGNYKSKWDAEGNSVAVDNLGNIYITDAGNHRIQKFTISGTFLRTWGWGVNTGAAQFEICTAASLPCQSGSFGLGDGQLRWPSGVAVDGAGHVYVADERNERIQKFDSSGNFLNKWGSYGTSAGQFDTPWGIAVSASGNVYVVDILNYRVQQFGTNTFGLDDALPNDGDPITDTLTLDILAPGSYMITETLSTGWFLNGINCTGGSSVVTDVPNQVVTINLVEDEDVVCTFVNEEGPKVFLPAVQYCPLLYADDFSNSSSGWSIVDTDDFLLEYKSSEYRILVRNGQFQWLGVSPEIFFGDYLVSVDARSINNNDGVWGLIFGGVSDWSGFYSFGVDNLGNYEIFRIDDFFWTPLATGSSGVINTGANANNALAVERTGTTINVFVNSVLIDSVNDGTYMGALKNGIFAFRASNGNVDVRYDNFRVVPIGCGLSTGTTTSSVSNAVNSVIGQGVLAIPWAYPPQSSDGQ
jgi:hypothetical protein